MAPDTLTELHHFRYRLHFMIGGVMLLRPTPVSNLSYLYRELPNAGVLSVIVVFVSAPQDATAYICWDNNDTLFAPIITPAAATCNVRASAAGLYIQLARNMWSTWEQSLHTA